jgi:hypothetical protein
MEGQVMAGMNRDLTRMVEQELRLEMNEHDINSSDIFDLAWQFIERNPQLSEATRKYLMWRGIAAFIDAEEAEAADAMRPD